MQILHYVTATNEDLFQDWPDGLRDRAARVAIQRRIDRLMGKSFGQPQQYEKLAQK